MLPSGKCRHYIYMGYTHVLVVIESSIYSIIWKYIFISKNVLLGKYTVSKGFFFLKLAKKLELFSSVLCSLPVMILLLQECGCFHLLKLFMFMNKFCRCYHYVWHTFLLGLLLGVSFCCCCCYGLDIFSTTYF